MDYIDSLCVSNYQSKHVKGFLQHLMDHLTSISASEVIALNDMESWCKNNTVCSPILEKPLKVDGNFQFIPPKKMTLVGSYSYKTSLTSKPTIDVALRIPKEFWNAKDHLNQRYLRKRAFYMTWIGVHLKDHGTDLVRSVKFAYDGHPMRPVILLKSRNAKISFRFKLIPVVKEPFNPNRFYPDRNNIRPQWYYDLPGKDKDSYEPTPFYNSLVLHDLNLIANNNLVKENVENDDFRKCVILIKSWCQRKGYSNLLEFPLTMFMIYLKKKAILTDKMNFLQLFRKTLLEFSESKWTDEPIYMRDEISNLDDFKKSHEVIFLDKSGVYNICYLISSDVYIGAKFEATTTLEKINSDHAQSLIMALSPVTLTEKFDTIISISGECIKKTCLAIESSKQKIMDHCGQMGPFFIKHILNLLNRALGNRVRVIQHDYRNFSAVKWLINDPRPSVAKIFQNIRILLILDQMHSSETIIKGPPADQPEANEFRQFWAEKSELRRFQEGSICETVFWESNSVADRRAIVGKIVKYILQKQAGIARKFVAVSGSQLDSFLWPAKLSVPGYGTGEESNRNIVANYESFSKKLRKCKDLPLTLSSVQGVSPAFRGTEVFPRDTVDPKYNQRIYSNKENCVVFMENTDNVHPKYIEPIDVVIHFETSGKWPSELEALKRVKAAFIIEMGEKLTAQYGLMCKPQKRYLDVWHEGMVFRVHIACNKEVHLMKQTVTPQGMIKTVESKEADKLTQFQIHLPIITSALSSVNSRFSAFSSVTRLAKCWISRHLLWDNIDEISIELLIAHLFLHPFPYSAPVSPLTGFIRFLRLLISFPWNRKPLIVNFNDELKLEEIQEIEAYYKENQSDLPSIFIATPFDKKKSMWTKEKPSGPIFQRLIFLASKCYDHLRNCIDNMARADFQPIFYTTTEIYDLTICLDKKHVPNFHLNLGFIRNNVISEEKLKAVAKRKEKNTIEYFPIVAFNPVNHFLETLQKHFANYALFFYDRFGGTKIYAIWKPHTFDLKPLYLSDVYNCKLTETMSKSGKPNVALDTEAVMEDMYILGDGLVTSIDANVSRWD